MPKLYLLFNHALTEAQEADARQSLGVAQFVALPEELQGLWQQVPAEADLDLERYLQPVCQWVRQAGSEDFVLIQGDFGAVYHLVRFCFRQGCGQPVYATTRRDASESPNADGSVTVSRRVRHVAFRHYR